MTLLNQRWPKVLPWIGLPLALACCWMPIAGAQPIDEYQAKAVFLYNFAKFVEWPSTAFKSDKDPINICVLGQNPFGAILDDTVRGKDVGGRPLIIVEISDVAHAASCQMVFFAAFNRKRFKPMCPELSAASVLTVGEADSFVSEGGIVNFKVEDGRIRIEINLSAAEQAKLRISSKLLSLARVVK